MSVFTTLVIIFILLLNFELNLLNANGVIASSPLLVVR